MTEISRVLRRTVAVAGAFVVTAAVGGGVPVGAQTTPAPPAGAGSAVSGREAPRLEDTSRYLGVPAFQDARNRQVKVRKIKFKRACPRCSVYQPKSAPGPSATANIEATASTYKILDQNGKYDFYLIDVNSEMTSRKGDKDWGWYDVTVTSIGKTKILGSSYSNGKDVQNVTKCKRFPVSLGVGYGGVSAGTTVGHVSFCNKGSKVTRSAVKKGSKYHATGVSGIRSLQTLRYIRVPEGSKPKFKVTVKANSDHWACGTFPDGYKCYVQRGFQTKSFKIGTTRQR